MQAAAFQPRTSNAALSGTRPLEWPSVDLMKKEVWGKRLQGKALEEAQEKYVRDRDTLQGSYKDFESHFVGMMLKQMHKTVEKNDMFHGGQVEDMFTERLNDEMAKNLVNNGKGFGIAEMLEQQHLRSTYHGNKQFATMIRNDWDQRAKAAANKEIDGTKQGANEIASAANALEGSEEPTLDAKQSYEARKAELMADAGIFSEEEQASGRINKRMMEIQQYQAYSAQSAKGFGIR